MLHPSQIEVLSRNMGGQVPPAIEERAKVWAAAFKDLTGQEAYVPQEILAAFVADHIVGGGTTAPPAPPGMTFTQPGQQSMQMANGLPPNEPSPDDNVLMFDGASSDGMAPVFFETPPSQQLTETRLAEIVANKEPVSATFVHPRTNGLASGLIVGHQGNMVAVRTSNGNAQETLYVSLANVQV